MKALTLSTLGILHRHRRSLLTFYLFFSGLAVAVLTPTFTWALATLRPVTGRAAISTGGIVEFLISPGGLVWVLATATLSLFMVLLQQAGMTLIAAAPAQRDYRTVLSTLTALWGVACKLRPLALLTMIQVITHLLIALPFVLVIALAWKLLISQYEGHYLRLELPPELWWFAGCATLAVIGMIVCNGWLYLRWILAVPSLVLENSRPLAALQHSSQLIHGHRAPFTGTLVFGLIAILLLPVMVTVLFQYAGDALFDVLPGRMGVLVPAVLAFVATYILLGIAITFLGMAAYSVLIYSLYRRATGLHRPVPATPRRLPKQAGPMAWAAEALVVILALGQAWFVLESLEQRDQVTITAHRGSAFKAPENTLSAIEQAIADGADYIEIDVQLTADGIPVLWHDSDMLRVFGLNERISEVTYEEIRQRDAGSWFDGAFANERIVTLTQAIATVRGRARLFIDLKPDRNTPNLAEEVVKLLQHQDFVEGTIIAAADWPILREVKHLDPRLKTALLAQFVVGPLWQDYYDILGLRLNQVSPTAIARAHQAGNELHVWTVNLAGDMGRFIDMGVDNIITDRPHVLAELLDSRSTLSDSELLVMKIRNWLR